MKNKEVKIENLIWRVSAIVCNADQIDAPGALSFEMQALFAYGKELGISDPDLYDELARSEEGMDGVSANEWQALRELEDSQKDLIFQRISALASADGEHAAEEKCAAEILRKLMG